MKKILVTGGTGYIGSHVARAFKQNGDNVFIIDRVSRRHALKDCDGFFIDDFASEASLATIIDLAPDVIVHCAGTSLVGPSMENPAEYYDNNISKTIKMLNVVKDMPSKPVILFSSSASVYGEPEELPITESANINPISPYGATKAMSERIFADYGRAYGIDSICFRYFNAAGAMPGTADLGQEPNATHIVARALEASIQNKPFTINGVNFDTEDGTCVRDYVHVWDIAQAHVLGVEYIDRLGHERTTVNEVCNLGTNSGVSNLEIVNYVKEKYGLDVDYGDRRWGDPATLVADASLARKHLGWTPGYSNISTIIDTAYAWYTRK